VNEILVVEFERILTMVYVEHGYLVSGLFAWCQGLLPVPTPAFYISPEPPACPSCSGVITEAVETVQNFPSLGSISSLG
jgi:hypothetical protein